MIKWLRRAVDGNPFDPNDEPDEYRCWRAACAVHSGPSTASKIHTVAVRLPAARRRHAAFEGAEI